MTSPRWCLLVLSLNVISASVAGAQTSADERAQFHFRAGTSYFEDGRYAESAEQFDEAYRLSQRPMLLANASLAYERAGNLAVAIERMEAFFAADVGDVGGGYMTSQERLEGLRARHALQLAEAEQAPAPEIVEEGNPAASSAEEADDARESDSPLRGTGLVVGASGVALGAAALGLGLRARAIHRDLTRVCGPAGDECPASRADDIERGPRLSRSAGALGITAGLSVALGLTLFLVGGASDDDEPVAQVAVDITPRRAQLTVSGSF